MGGGSWDTGTYRSSATSRKTSGVKDFSYTTHATSAHDTLDPKRINSKTDKKLESRDSTEHPASNAVLVCFDVTGSNYERAVDAQKRLPSLMELLNKYLPDPQVAVAANDDVNSVGAHAVQVSEFESDNRIDDHIRNIWLVGKGGGNDGESYDLLLYLAARKVSLDCVEKRGKKGYMFLYADEPIFDKVRAAEVATVFGDSLQGDISIEEIIEEARRNFTIFVIWPDGGYKHAHDQYKKLFGEEFVLVSQHPNLICELIASTIGLYEEKTTPDAAIKDLVSLGVSDKDAKALVKHVSSAASSLATSGGGKAARL